MYHAVESIQSPCYLCETSARNFTPATTELSPKLFLNCPGVTVPIPMLIALTRDVQTMAQVTNVATEQPFVHSPFTQIEIFLVEFKLEYRDIDCNQGLYANWPLWLAFFLFF